MASPLVDVTIAVHSATRPIARAVASVLEGTAAPIRVNVVAHNIDPEVIRANLGSYADHPDVRLHSLQDGVYSPAGPMNHGLSTSTAPFCAVMGSDDEFAPGAIDSWLALQQETDADAVLARIQLANGSADHYPPVRGGRRLRELDPVRDRLAYRSAPLGLIRRARFGDLRFTEGLPSGEDLAYSTALWFTGRHLAYDLHGPAYVINADAGDRVTAAPRPMLDDFRFLDAIEALPWRSTATERELEALVVKILRIHVFDAIAARVTVDDARRSLPKDLADVLAKIRRLSSRAERLLSRADRIVLDAVLSGRSSAEEIQPLLTARWQYRSFAAMLPRNPLLAMHAQAPFRTLRAGSLTVRTS